MYASLPSSLSRLENPTFGKAFARQPFRKESDDAGVVITQSGEIYQLMSIIGTGGLSVVYKACRLSDDKVVALKLADNSKSTDAANLLKREGVIMATLRHPNVVKIIERGLTVDGDPYIAMELLDGQTLDEVLDSYQKLDPAIALEICLQIASAIDYIHKRGFLHRDIKPSNIMISPEGRAIIFDFGISVAMDDQGQFDGDSSSSGSLIYASPEQLAQKPLGTATDVYQLALVLFEILTGRLPFEVSVTGALAYRRRGPLLPADEELDGELAPDLRAVLESALQRESRERTTCMKAFAEGMGQALDSRL